MSAAWVLPSLVGGPIAGWLASTVSWRWVFWVVVLPAGVAGSLLLLRRAALRTSPDTGTLGVQGDSPDARGIGDDADNHGDADDHGDAGGHGDAGTPADERREHRRTARLGAVVAGSAGLVQLAIHERPPVFSLLSALAALGLIGVAVAAPKLLPPGTFHSARGCRPSS